MYDDEKTYDLRRRMLESIGNSLVQYWDDGEPVESFFILCAIGCLGSKSGIIFLRKIFKH